MPNVGFEVDVEQSFSNRFPRDRRVAIDVVANDIDEILPKQSATTDCRLASRKSSLTTPNAMCPLISVVWRSSCPASVASEFCARCSACRPMATSDTASRIDLSANSNGPARPSGCN